jgi:hypothetical protein
MSFLLLLISTPQQNWRKAENRFCLEARGRRGEGGGGVQGRRNDPNNVCTCE